MEFGRRFGIPVALPVIESVLCWYAAYLGDRAAHTTVKVALFAIRSKHVDLALG